MSDRDFETVFSDLRRRCEALPPERQDEAITAFTEALTLCEMPPDPNETWEIIVSLRRASEITYQSG
jgi:hypothetical protein